MPIATFCPHKHPFLPFFPNRNSWILNLLSYLFKKSWDWVLRWVRYKKESVFQKKTSINFRTFDDDDEGADADAGVIRQAWWRQRARKCSKEYEKDEENGIFLYHLASRMPNWRSFWLLQGKKYVLRHVTGVGYPMYKS